MPFNDPAPQDLSGGFFVGEYVKGNLRHRQRVHVLPFNDTTLDYTSPRGTETNVSDTALAWATVWAAFYDTGWTWSVQSVWSLSSGTPTVLPVLPAVSASGSVSGGGIVAPKLLSGEAIFNFRTTLGNRGRFIFIAKNGWEAVPPGNVDTSSSGAEGGLMTYLRSADCMVVFHDGTQPVDHAIETFPYNSRLRRHYHEG